MDTYYFLGSKNSTEVYHHISKCLSLQLNGKRKESQQKNLSFRTLLSATIHNKEKEAIKRNRFERNICAQLSSKNRYWALFQLKAVKILLDSRKLFNWLFRFSRSLQPEKNTSSTWSVEVKHFKGTKKIRIFKFRFLQWHNWRVKRRILHSTKIASPRNLHPPAKYHNSENGEGYFLPSMNL